MSMVAGDADNWDVFSEVATSAPGAEAMGERFLSEMMAGGGVMGGVGERREVGAESADDDSDVDSEYSLDGQKRLKHGQEVNAITAAAMELRAKGGEWSSAIRANTYAALQRGRYAQAGPDRQPVDEQLIFKAPMVLNITELETAGGLYDRLKAGTVVASVVGATGIGKSTKFSGKIAQKVGCRVLQISPDCVLKEDHGEQLSKLVTISPFWSKSKQPMVSLMTPQEFCGRFFVDGWKEMISCFDVVVLDEAHIPSYWNNGVKAAVTSKCIGSVSLLMLTATMKGVEDLQSSTQRPLYVPTPIEKIVGDDDFMESSYAVDRSMFIVESNERLQAVASALAGVGCIVLTLESGSSRDAVRRVESALKGDSPAVRILVAHAKFGYGTNLPIARVVTTGLRQYVASDGNGGYVWKRTPLSAAEVKQHLGRADRGMVSSSGQGVVLLEQHMLAPQVDLLESEKFSFYVLLVAMGIRPSKKLRATFESMLPHGLTRRVAVAIMGVYGLPAEVVVRFLAEDGAFPHSYTRSLRQFSTVGSQTIVSEHKNPVGFEDWVEIDAFGILGKDFGPKIKVPFMAEGELMILLTFVCAAAQGLYVPEVAPMLQDDGYTSGPEREVRRVKKWAGITYKPTPLEITPVTREISEEPKRRKGFVLDVPLDQQPNYRRAGSVVFPQHVKDALGIVDYAPKVVEEVDSKGRIYIKFVDDLDPESPVEVVGKSKIFMLPKPVWRQLQKGEVLNEAAFKLLLNVIKKHFREFAASSAFANWGDPWVSVLASFAEDEYVGVVKGKGVVPQVVSFLALLWQRYYAGMEAAVRESHWSLNFWRKMVVKFKMTRNMAPRPEMNGTVEVAQSNAFKQRLYLIRLNFALVIEACERNSVFAHEAVTNLQNILPISQRLGHSVYDAVWDGNAVPSGMRQRPASSEYESMSEQGYRVVELTDDFDSALGRLGSRFGSRSSGY